MSLMVMFSVVMPMVVMPMVVMPMVMMLVVMMLMILSVGGLACQGGRMSRLRVLRCIVGCSGVNVEFHTGDSGAGLTLEMQVAIAQLQFGEFPFESGRGDPQIG